MTYPKYVSSRILLQQTLKVTKLAQSLSFLNNPFRHTPIQDGPDSPIPHSCSFSCFTKGHCKFGRFLQFQCHLEFFRTGRQDGQLGRCAGPGPIPGLVLAQLQHELSHTGIDVATFVLCVNATKSNACYCHTAAALDGVVNVTEDLCKQIG